MTIDGWQTCRKVQLLQVMLTQLGFHNQNQRSRPQIWRRLQEFPTETHSWRVSGASQMLNL